MNVVVACYPEDLVTEFLSLLDRDSDQPLEIVLASSGTVISLPPGDLLSRIAAIASHLDASDGSAVHVERSKLASILDETVPDDATVWTHCPADARRNRATVGWLAALNCSPRAVLHSVGVSSHYQFLSEVAVQMSVEQTRLKLDFLAKHASAFVQDDLSGRHISTEAVLACERFVRLAKAEADRMYALLHSMEDDASLIVDPWDFQHSPYERERLGRTAEWVGRHVTSTEHAIVEIGACEGALTSRLIDAGHRVLACEPNARFRTRLAEAVDERADVTAHSLEELVERIQIPAEAYLLIEMVYYVEDLSILDGVPAELLFLACNSEELRDRVDPWLAKTDAWQPVDRLELVAPRIDHVSGERVYHRKAGSVGVLCRRAAAVSR